MEHSVGVAGTAAADVVVAAAAVVVVAAVAAVVAVAGFVGDTVSDHPQPSPLQLQLQQPMLPFHVLCLFSLVATVLHHSFL